MPWADLGAWRGMAWHSMAWGHANEPIVSVYFLLLCIIFSFFKYLLTLIYFLIINKNTRFQVHKLFIFIFWYKIPCFPVMALQSLESLVSFISSFLIKNIFVYVTDEHTVLVQHNSHVIILIFTTNYFKVFIMGVALSDSWSF